MRESDPTGHGIGQLEPQLEFAGRVLEHDGVAVPEPARPWLSFAVGDGAVRDLAGSLVSWLQAPQDIREATRDGLVEVVRERYSWEGVARTVVGAARGELSELAEVI